MKAWCSLVQTSLQLVAECSSSPEQRFVPLLSTGLRQTLRKHPKRRHSGLMNSNSSVVSICSQLLCYLCGSGITGAALPSAGNEEWLHRVNTESSSDSLYAPCGLSLLLRFPLQHTSSLNYLLPFLSHFKDRCTNHKPEQDSFIMSSLFKPQGFVTGWVVLTHSAPQVFFKLVTLRNRNLLLITQITHTHTPTVCSTVSYSPPCSVCGTWCKIKGTGVV